MSSVGADDADADSGAGRFRRSSGPRSVKRSLATIVLGFETIVVFLGAVVTLGLVSVATEPGPISPLTVIIGGVLLCLAMVVLIALLRFRWSYPIGWLLQAVIIATGFITPAMFFVGALFAAMWTYCMVTGSRIDHQKEIE
ncbi:DUF4233 domain-containing protein [Cryobacterium sp. Y29]|uniref:DUF4233 domain-containing protein n=1 Tax=Cryobacterium sp. Y29 TaxID=2048285 RepID=UPI001E551159|nr:DUF4233 domain-containing protein [Cryobacterium sp. Y29]